MEVQVDTQEELAVRANAMIATLQAQLSAAISEIVHLKGQIAVMEHRTKE